MSIKLHKIEDALGVEGLIDETKPKTTNAKAMVILWIDKDGEYCMTRAGYNRDQLWLLEMGAHHFKRVMFED